MRYAYRRRLQPPGDDAAFGSRPAIRARFRKKQRLPEGDGAEIRAVTPRYATVWTT